MRHALATGAFARYWHMTPVSALFPTCQAQLRLITRFRALLDSPKLPSNSLRAMNKALLIRPEKLYIRHSAYFISLSVNIGIPGSEIVIIQICCRDIFSALQDIRFHGPFCRCHSCPLRIAALKKKSSISIFVVNEIIFN